MTTNTLPTNLQTAQGHAFPLDVLAKSGVSVRSVQELEEIIDEHAKLTGRPMAKSATQAKPISASLAAKRRAGRRAWEATAKQAAFASN